MRFNTGRWAFFIAIVAATPFATVAPGHAEEMDEEQCARLHPEITSPVEMVTCTSDLEGSRKQLNKAYGALAKVISKDAFPLLEKGQKAWLAFRNAQCEYETGGMENTMGTSDKIACTARMNRSRATELESDVQRWK